MKRVGIATGLAAVFTVGYVGCVQLPDETYQDIRLRYGYDTANCLKKTYDLVAVYTAIALDHDADSLRGRLMSGKAYNSLSRDNNGTNSQDIKYLATNHTHSGYKYETWGCVNVDSEQLNASAVGMPSGFGFVSRAYKSIHPLVADVCVPNDALVYVTRDGWRKTDKIIISAIHDVKTDNSEHV